MKVLVLNCGSSSLKYQLINMTTEDVIAKGNFERIGQAESFLTHKVGDEKHVIETPIPTHEDAIKVVLEQLTNEAYGVIKDLSEIEAIGHRLVHGGEKFNSSVIINDEVVKAMEDCIDLAPLHNPPGIAGIRACQHLMPNVKMVGVFDTAFHQTMPKEAFLYAIPYEWYEKFGVRRYGFHGTSHRYISERAAELLGKSVEDLNIITCHLGQGASICAVKGGKSIDTTMGLTPLAGIPMGTRSGDIDPAIIQFMMEHEDLSLKQVMLILNKESGSLGISGVSSDNRDIEKAAEEGNERAKLALDKFEYEAAKKIGEYQVAMGGVDAIIFAGGIGENAPSTREGICKRIKCLGVDIDLSKNDFRGEERTISTPDSKVSVMVIPTNEELAIARDTKKLVELEKKNNREKKCNNDDYER